MALDHSRLGLENKFKFLYVLHITSEVKQYYTGAVCIMQTSDRMQYFTIFQDDQLWALSETVQKCPKSPSIDQYRSVCGQAVLTFDKRQICSAICVTVFE